jgi:hypothetical protein
MVFATDPGSADLQSAVSQSCTLRRVRRDTIAAAGLRPTLRRSTDLRLPALHIFRVKLFSKERSLAGPNTGTRQIRQMINRFLNSDATRAATRTSNALGNDCRNPEAAVADHSAVYHRDIRDSSTLGIGSCAGGFGAVAARLQRHLRLPGVRQGDPGVHGVGCERVCSPLSRAALKPLMSCRHPIRRIERSS